MGASHISQFFLILCNEFRDQPVPIPMFSIFLSLTP